MKALGMQIKSEMVRTLRNRKFVFFALLMPLGFYFLFVTQYGPAMQIGGAQWSAYLLMSMTVYGVLMGSVSQLANTLAQERKLGWYRLLHTTPAPAWGYLSSKMIAQLGINLALIVIMFLVGHFTENVDLSASQWVSCALSILFGSLVFLSLGGLIAVLLGAEAAPLAAVGIQLALSFLGGLWTPVQAFPDTLRKLAEWLPSYRIGHVPWNIVSGVDVAWQDFAVTGAYLILFVLVWGGISKRQEAVAA
ncbi:hypothetical protein EL26_18755 [Tumebacillus flagellatus]|uniref:ABC-2 type transporter transmembrane domain-containing protein n=2 Tax=Tumebacillus flagellatus TaxID=1157490 RepID=A0A074LL88_9BACL|nr:hypothetical protein EL26_18755 [Tumebacillus flagellatus]